MNKFGTYIQKLMATVIDTKEDEFVQSLAINELNRLKVNIDEFLLNYLKDDSDDVKKTEKILLNEQENKGD